MVQGLEELYIYEHLENCQNLMFIYKEDVKRRRQARPNCRFSLGRKAMEDAGRMRNKVKKSSSINLQGLFLCAQSVPSSFCISEM